MEAGTVEIFRNSGECKARGKYLQSMNDPSLGAIGVNAYMIRYQNVILRVSYDLTKGQAKRYVNFMTKYLSEQPKESSF